MHLPDFLEIPLRLALLLAGLLVPGSMVLRALRLPWSLASAFVTSAAALYAVVLLFACTGFTISLVTLTVALGAVALAGRFVPTRPVFPELNSSFSCFTKMGPWLPLYLAFWIIVGYRLVVQPLSGPDVNFRWSYLAEQILRYGTLDFYPPRTGTDFVRYFWAESYPPGIASLYAWTYACAGSMQALWTSPVVALQLLSLHELIWRLGSRWGGEVVARRAVLLAAACPLLTWSVLIGQETGLIAVGITGLVWCLHHLRVENSRRWAALAGIFALGAAGTREYSPVFAAAAVGVAWFMRLPRRSMVVISAVALPAAVLWPMRVWVLTGNPFYSLNLGGLLPVNQVFNDWNDSLRAPHAFHLLAPSNWFLLGRYLMLWALPACVGLAALVALLGQRLREAQIVAWFVGLLVLLWFSSVFYTAGGLFYSLRVLSPAFALLAVVAAYASGLYIQQVAAAKFVALAVALVVLEAIPKTLVLPENPYKIAVREWLQAGDQFIASVRIQEQQMVAKLQPLRGRAKILSDSAGWPRVLAPIGTEVAPLWSPDVAWLFDATLKPEEIARRWRKSGFRYLLLGKSGPASDFVRMHARWRAPYFFLTPVAETNDQVVIEVTTAGLPGP
jgi:hypothetical protein